MGLELLDKKKKSKFNSFYLLAIMPKNSDTCNIFKA